MKKEKNRLRWVRLDNAAKIYPAARRKNWSNIYRQSATLNEEVDVEFLMNEFIDLYQDLFLFPETMEEFENIVKDL